MRKLLALLLLLTIRAAGDPHPSLDDPDREALQKPDEVVRLLQPSPGMVVADVGAGTGYFESRLSRAVGPGGQVWAVEIDPSLVEQMRSRFAREGLSNVEARLAQPDDPGLPEQSVDRILLVDTWHHVRNRGPLAEKLRRALKPGGRLLLVDYTLEAPVGPPAHMRLAPETVIQELEAAGFTPRLEVESLPNQYVISAGQHSP
jgi:predicted methyltransferase